MEEQSEKLFLIDGNAILHRAFYAIPPFKTKDGKLVNAVYGFASMLLNLLNKEKPEYIAVSFDMKGKTFRHEEYDQYKATRTKAPDGLYEQLPLIKELVGAFEIPIHEVEGFEADDVLGTLAEQAAKTEKITTYVVTGDMDALQLINEKVKVLSPIKGFNEITIYDTAAVLGKYGLNPRQITDMEGLQGDSSDNIKGVRGIGKKTAKILLQKYGNIENIYKNMDGIKGKLNERLTEGKENAFFSKKLATIITKVPIMLNLENCHTHEYDIEKIEKFFLNFEFGSLIKKLQNFNNHYSVKKREANGLQGTLF